MPVSRGPKCETDFLVILDKSGSMEDIRGETIRNFNEQMQAITTAARTQKVKMSLVTFSGPTEIETVFWRSSEAPKLTEEDYVPWGSTALYDAVWEAVQALSEELGERIPKPKSSASCKEPPAVLVIIISDGEENESYKHTSKDVAELIQELQATDRWTFTYIGANQDLSVVSKRLGIPAGNTLGYTSDSYGTRVAGLRVEQAMVDYVESRAGGCSQQSRMFGTDSSMAGKDLTRKR